MIPPGFKFLPKHENMESILYPVYLSSNMAIKTLAGWGEKNLDILLSCNTRTGFSDRNSGPKLCAVSIANNGNQVFQRKNLVIKIMNVGGGWGGGWSITPQPLEIF